MKKVYAVLILFIAFASLSASVLVNSKSSKEQKNDTTQLVIMTSSQSIKKRFSIIQEDAIRQKKEQLRIEQEYKKEQAEQGVKINEYTEEELFLLSHLIYGESSGCPDELQLSVGSVVLNRVKSSLYPNTIEGVIYQSGQYACVHDGNFNKTPDEQAVNNAEYLLMYGSQLPENVVYQAEFIQGSGVYSTIGNTYFCY